MGAKVTGSEIAEQFLDSLWLESGLSGNTLSAYRSDLTGFETWLYKKGLDLKNASRAELLGYLAANVRQGLSPRSSARRLSTLRRFYRYLVREGMIQNDPTADIRSPSLGRPLPKAITEASVEKVTGGPWEYHAGTSGPRDAGDNVCQRPQGIRTGDLGIERA